jgi:hypothetical protein
MAVKNQKQVAASCQQHLKIAEIQDNCMTLKDGGIRSMLKVSPINFDLKSEDEQNGTIYAYQEFLNTLEFPIQIVVKSKKLDIDGYLGKMDKLYSEQTSDLLKALTSNYIEYISKLVEIADIMQKEFYVVIPADPFQVQKGLNPFQKFLKALNPMDTLSNVKKRKAEHESLKKKLEQRTQSVMNGLANIGLKPERLDTYELITVFYKSYNPDLTESQKIKDISNIDVPINPGNKNDQQENEQ